VKPQDQAWREHLDRVCAGDQAACQDFWQQYGPLIEGVAQQHVSSKLRRRVGPESIVLSVCRTFFRRAQHGDFQFADEEAAWRLLCVITVTKIREKARYHARKKRGLEREVSLAGEGDEAQQPFKLASNEPPPDVIAEFNDQLAYLLQTLPEEEQQVLELRLQQCTQDEIAQRLQCSERTVRRMIKRIHVHFSHVLDNELSGATGRLDTDSSPGT
jgi:RNA polymerase sigma factor (sigma-70 family)